MIYQGAPRPWYMVRWPLKVGSELMSHVKELEKLLVFVSEGSQHRDVDGWVGAHLVLMRALH